MFDRAVEGIEAGGVPFWAGPGRTPGEINTNHDETLPAHGVIAPVARLSAGESESEWGGEGICQTVGIASAAAAVSSFWS